LPFDDCRRFFVLLLLLASTLSFSQTNSSPIGGMQWRLIGPFRAGRITAVSGVPRQPQVYYAATPNGGVWKTSDGGNTWQPIFDKQPVASIGTLAVSESNPNIIYVGSGEQTQGDGVYKSTDGGATWTNVGLEKTHVITSLQIDPRNPDIVLVGVAGDSASGDERGVFRTTDGGKHWQKVLFKDPETAVMDMNMAPGAPNVVYASLQHRRTGAGLGVPGERAAQQDSYIYRSTDSGATWTPISGKGLPTLAMGRVGVAVAPGSGGKTVFAICTQGLFRSDDSGESWAQTTKDPRVVGSGYFSRVFVDPRNPKIVYVAQTSMYRSEDGGKTFDAVFGAPSGDDFHNMWINPLDTQHMIAGVDQGAIVSVNGGKTWTTWYNQPTGQFYHVSTDNQFPYRVYAAQQDSGTAGVLSRSDFGEITYRDWAPVGGFEFAYIEPDPLHPDLVYTGGWYGSVLRFDRTTNQIVHVFVRTPKYRTAQMAPIAFSPQDPHSLYVGAQFVMKTTDGGINWEEVSPDLTIKNGATPAPGGGRAQPAAITTLSLSPVQAGEIWAGTVNGLIHLTRDGKTWQNVTPPGLPDRSNIVQLEASHHDPGTAFAVVNAFQNMQPLMFRTRDFGQSWQPITNGIRPGFIARVIRDDPERKGLLYAGTETGVWVSFDDGDQWQSLQLNLPISSLRDLAVHGNDLVAATYGRALWILDDVSPLRQFNPAATPTPVQLLKPAQTIRTRWDMNQDTPLPAETPAGKNPPDGAILYYSLNSPVSGPLKLSIYDSHDQLVRQYTSVAPSQDHTPANAPEYWFADPVVLPNNRGVNRFVWDLRYPPPKTMRYSYYGNLLDYIEYTLADHAIPEETPREQPQGPLVLPGNYTVLLETEGKSYKQPLTVTLDPRLKVSQQDLASQLDVQLSIISQMAAASEGYFQVAALRSAIADRQKQLSANSASSTAADAVKKLDEQAALIQQGDRTELGLGPSNRELARLAAMIGSGDSRPAAVLQKAVADSCHVVASRLAQWREMNSKSISELNTQLQQASLSALPVTTNAPADPQCPK
jgi:photosystem II stability/assembly factor-like uncharacterized protein